MNIKVIAITLGLLFTSAGWAATEKVTTNPTASKPSQSSSSGQSSGAKRAPTSSQNQDKPNIPPKTAEFCREHTC